MIGRSGRIALLLAVSVASVAWTDVASAQGSPADAARLFDEANAAMDKKDFQTACPKLERVIQIIPEAAGARLALGECYEAFGKVASALRAYELAVVALAKANDRSRLTKTEQKVKALAGRVARLTLQLGPRATGATGLTVTFQGGTLPRAEVPRAELGAPRPLDAGTYAVEASAEAMQPFKASVTLADGDKKTLPVELEPVAASGSASPASPAPPADAPSSSEAPSASYWGGQRVASVILGGLGVVGVGVGAGLGVSAMSTLDASAASCNEDSDICATQEGLDLRDQAILESHGSTIGFVAGGALLGLGAVLFFTADPDTTFGPAEPAVALRVRGTFLSLEGSLGSW